MKKTDILIVGTGAVGSYFGGKLFQEETRVSAFCRSDYDVIKEKGIIVRSYKGDFVVEPFEVVNDIKNLSMKPDYIIVCLKVLPEINLPDIIRPAVGEDTTIVLIQNGIAIENEVASAFPENEIISGIAFIAISRIELGVARHTGSGKIVLGSYPNGISEKCKKLADLFKKAEVPCSSSSEITRERWKKMVWNASFNPISVLGGNADSKQMVEVPESEELVRNVMNEVLAVAKSDGYELKNDIIEDAISGNRKMRPFKTSMLVDFEQNRTMEIDAILGNTITIARNNGVPTPYLQSLYCLLKLQITTSIRPTIEES
ncbi:2-dehydropantoate 2-reductase [bacterium]|nr:2-dehydropantoate 2-reductase [bacterium]